MPWFSDYGSDYETDYQTGIFDYFLPLLERFPAPSRSNKKCPEALIFKASGLWLK